MIDKSLERINTKSISLRSEKKAIPVYFSTNISKIKKKLTSANYNFLKALGFNSIYGNWIVLSDTNGQISSVIVGLKKIKKNYSKFLIGSILSKLPKGTYLLKNIPKTEDINLLALGFFLSFYSFKDFDKKIKHGKNTVSPILSLPNFPNLDKTLYFAESEFRQIGRQFSTYYLSIFIYDTGFGPVESGQYLTFDVNGQPWDSDNDSDDDPY